MLTAAKSSLTIFTKSCRRKHSKWSIWLNFACPKRMFSGRQVTVCSKDSLDRSWLSPCISLSKTQTRQFLTKSLICLSKKDVFRKCLSKRQGGQVLGRSLCLSNRQGAQVLVRSLCLSKRQGAQVLAESLHQEQFEEHLLRQQWLQWLWLRPALLLRTAAATAHVCCIGGSSSSVAIDLLIGGLCRTACSLRFSAGRLHGNVCSQRQLPD